MTRARPSNAISPFGLIAGLLEAGMTVDTDKPIPAPAPQREHRPEHHAAGPAGARRGTTAITAAGVPQRLWQAADRRFMLVESWPVNRDRTARFASSGRLRVADVGPYRCAHIGTLGRSYYCPLFPFAGAGSGLAAHPADGPLTSRCELRRLARVQPHVLTRRPDSVVLAPQRLLRPGMLAGT